MILQATGYFFLFNQQIDALFTNGKTNSVAIAHGRERSTNSGLWRNMQHDRTKCGAGHSSVRNSYHVLHSRPRELERNWQITRLGHGGSLWPRILQHQNVVWIHIEFGIVDSLAKSSRLVKTTARPSVSKSEGVAAARLKIAPSAQDYLVTQSDRQHARRDR